MSVRAGGRVYRSLRSHDVVCEFEPLVWIRTLFPLLNPSYQEAVPYRSSAHPLVSYDIPER